MRFLMLNWRDPENPLAGGAERVTQAYLEALAARGHEVWWFANHFPGAAPAARLGAIQLVRGGGKGTSVAAARRWHRTQAPFDLVIDQHHGIPWFAPWWAGTRCIAYIHEVLGPIWNSFYPEPIASFGRWQERWTHWAYRRVPFFTASADTKRHLHAHGVQDVTIIPYGVHTRALPQLDPKPLAPPWRLIVVSRLAPNKRVDHAILAHQALRQKGLDSRLTIVGGGEMEASLRALVARLGLPDTVTFTGPLPEAEKNERLRQSHFLLHTSQREGWGLNVIEANAMGTPAAVYPVAGLVESTLDNETGVLAAAETPAALADRLAAVLPQDDAYQRWRRRAWERAQTFHWDHVLPVASDWFERMATTPRPAP